MQSKNCSKCNQEKDVSCFTKQRDKKSGYSSQCRECRKLSRRARKKYLEENPPAIPPNKKCGDCKKEKTSQNFSSSAYAGDGLRPICKPCDVKRVSEYRQTEIGREKARKNDKTYHYNPKHLRKIQAKRKVLCAIRRGDLVRPNACSECGKTCVPDLHHDDYNKPLDVRALCRQCHVDYHRTKGEGLNA